MTWFNVYDSDGDGLTRKVILKVDLAELPLSQWTLNELGFRLAFLFPLVDGYGSPKCTEADRVEIQGLVSEIERRGYEPYSNLQYNERVTGWGWLPGFRRKPWNHAAKDS